MEFNTDPFELCEILDSFLKDYEAVLKAIGFSVRLGEVKCKSTDDVINALSRHMKAEFLKRLEERRQNNVESKRITKVA
jgi:hypothetical protein